MLAGLSLLRYLKTKELLSERIKKNRLSLLKGLQLGISVAKAFCNSKRQAGKDLDTEDRIRMALIV